MTWPYLLHWLSAWASWKSSGKRGRLRICAHRNPLWRRGSRGGSPGSRICNTSSCSWCHCPMVSLFVTSLLINTPLDRSKCHQWYHRHTYAVFLLRDRDGLHIWLHNSFLWSLCQLVVNLQKRGKDIWQKSDKKMCGGNSAPNRRAHCKSLIIWLLSNFVDICWIQ